MFTMLIGLICMKGIRWAEEIDWGSEENGGFPRLAVIMLITAVGALTAEFLHVDYGAAGIILILIFYNFSIPAGRAMDWRLYGIISDIF